MAVYKKDRVSIGAMTFEQAMKKALSTPLKDSKVNQDNNKTKKATKKS